MRAQDVEFDVHEYLKSPLDAGALATLLDGFDGKPEELVRKDKNFKALELASEDYQSRESVVELLVEHPKLMQRPLVTQGGRTLIARPPELLKDFLGLS